MNTETIQHTPGPWAMSRYAGGDYGIYDEQGTGRDIALVRTTEADARLIEAAPDLLAALETLQAAITRKTVDGHVTGFGYNDLAEMLAAWRSAEDAIAKARGDA